MPETQKILEEKEKKEETKEVKEKPKKETKKEKEETQEKEAERIEPKEIFVNKDVKSITFSVLSPQMIKKMASAKVVTPELYDKEGYPVDGGLMDIRLGVIDPGLKCKTCGSKLKECSGHFGYIELARPILHIKFVNVIINLLKCTCRDCGRILIPKNKIDKAQQELERIEKEAGIEERRQHVKNIISGTKTVNKCPWCKARQQKITIEKPTTLLENEKRLNPIEIRTRLEKIQDEDLELFGLIPKHARPEWMILTIMPIPPVTMRPSITLESGERSEDDLTHKLGDIVRINQRLFENINAGAPEIIIEDLWDLLQYHITTFFDNNVSELPPARHRSGQPLKTITERIKSKEGRIRHNLAGKRTNFSSRTVISPDPMLELNEVGVPIEIAMKLTVPERVNKWNIEYLKKFVERGPNKYPGANYIIRPDGKKKKLTEETIQASSEELEPNYIVERQLLDGDIALFNRQPSLHRMSMMCHKVKVLPYKTLRLNPAVCVAPSTKVDLSSGIKRKIDELKNCWKESELATFDWKNKLVKATELKKFWGLKPEAYNAKCYKLVTEETGREIIATGDHPFYTNKGIKPAKDIKAGDKVIVRPLDTPEYQNIDKLVVAKEQIKAPQTYIRHSLKVLEELELIPLNMKDQRVMILARLLGHLFGDGTFILKGDVARLIFRGSKEDLVTIQNDIRSLGFEPEKIYIRSYDSEIQTIKGKKLRIVGKGASFEIRNKPLALLFNALGAPNGDKIKNEFLVPEWILNAPAYIKREFIGSYFGSELSSPALRHNSKTNFRTLRFKLSKIEEKINHGLSFINQIKDMLKKFGVGISLISKEPGNIRKDGRKTVSLVANINSNKSYLNLFGKIGYIYSKQKDDKARLAYQYSSLKEKEIKKRRGVYKRFFEMRKKDYKFKQISKKLNISIGVLENWACRGYNAGLLSDFVYFEEWCEKVTDGIKETGLVWETVDKKEKNYCPFVYDVTTTTDTHNFFANGFLTKNCHPYNADFDGDEMNLHIPQTEESRAEAEILMEVQTQLISPRYGLSIIGCVQDAISGNYILTKDMELTRAQAIDLLTFAGINDFSKLPKKEKINGKEVFSVLIPDDFNFTGKAKHYNPTLDKKANIERDAYVIIKDGKLTSGIMDRNNLGEGSGLLLRNIHKRYGKEKAVDLLGKLFRLGIGVLSRVGFTTAISDTDLPESAVLTIKETLQNAEREVNELINLYNNNKLEEFPGKTVKETLELKILEILNRARNKAGELVAKHADKNSPTMIMADSGARGNLLNLAQMAACVGQQAMRGKRIEKGYKERTLSCFKRGDLSPAAHGFISNGFKTGLNPYEFFFGAMTGRDSLMDTALRTPKSGYLYRRLSNAMQDLKAEYDSTIRDAAKRIIQFNYGEDGIDVSKSEGGILNVKRIIKTVGA